MGHRNLGWKHTDIMNSIRIHSSIWINRISNLLSLKHFTVLVSSSQPPTQAHTTPHFAHFLIVKALALIICSRNFSIRRSFLDFCLMLSTLLPFWLLFLVLVLPEKKKREIEEKEANSKLKFKYKNYKVIYLENSTAYLSPTFERHFKIHLYSNFFPDMIKSWQYPV